MMLKEAKGWHISHVIRCGQSAKLSSSLGSSGMCVEWEPLKIAHGVCIREPWLQWRIQEAEMPVPCNTISVIFLLTETKHHISNPEEKRVTLVQSL